MAGNVGLYGINVNIEENSAVKLLELTDKKRSGTINRSEDRILTRIQEMILGQVEMALRPLAGVGCRSRPWTIREMLEEHERTKLSLFAARSYQATRDRRDKYADEDDLRTHFMIDRDRIIYSNPFRRLANKTQVFISPKRDHCTTRMSHSLEVAQIARSIARYLSLNEDLTEAIALGHDVGTPPFGHAGEEVLNELSPHGFKHNEQSVRVFEVVGRQGGYNLTKEVRNGIVCHNKGQFASTLEGQIVRIADKIAFISRDPVDLIRAGIIKKSDLPSECVKVLGETPARWIDTMIRDVVETSRGKDIISFSPEMEKVVQTLKYYMLDIFNQGPIKEQNDIAKHVVTHLYQYFKAHPNEMPKRTQDLLNSYDIDTVLCDYIASMTDNYAIDVYNSIFIPLNWSM